MLQTRLKVLATDPARRKTTLFLSLSPASN